MKSMIDQIYDIEDHIAQLKENGNKEIKEIYDSVEQKIKMMEQSFLEDYLQYEKHQEEEMLHRVQLYDQELQSAFRNKKDLLQELWEEKKDKILLSLSQEFWLE